MRKKERGSLTAFTAMMLVPLMLLFGICVDGSRLLYEKSMLSDAARLSVNAAMASYDRSLMQGYGLCVMNGLTQATSAAKQSFAATVMPETEDAVSFLAAEGSLQCSGVDGARLSDPCVFEAQICEYMKYFTDDLLDEDQILMGTGELEEIREVLALKFCCDKELYRAQELCNAVRQELSGQVNVPSFTCLQACLNQLRRAKESIVLLQKACAETLPGSLAENMAAAAGRMESCLPDDAALRAAEGLLEQQGNIVSWEPLYGFLESLEPWQEDTNEALLAERGRKLEKGHDTSTPLQTLPHGFPAISPENKALPYAVDTTLPVSDILDSVSLSLQKLTDTYGDTAYLKELLDTQAPQRDILLAEYACGMFGSYKCLPVSVSGRNLFDGDFPSVCPYGEIEYLLCGGADPTANAGICFSRIYDYCFLWKLCEKYCVDRSAQEKAVSNARQIAAEGKLACFLHEDLLLVAEACEEAAKAMHEEADGWMQITLFRGSDYLTMDYPEFLKLFLLYDMKTERENVLERMRAVIEKNMRARGDSDFSFDDCHTMLSVDITAQLPSCFLRTRSCTYHTLGSY